MDYKITGRDSGVALRWAVGCVLSRHRVLGSIPDTKTNRKTGRGLVAVQGLSPLRPARPGLHDSTAAGWRLPSDWCQSLQSQSILGHRGAGAELKCRKGLEWPPVGAQVMGCKASCPVLAPARHVARGVTQDRKCGEPW